MYDACARRYAKSAAAVQGEQHLELNELLDYLRANNDGSLGPLDAVRAQADAMGDPAVPAPQHIIALHWLQDAFALWMERYPMEPQLAQLMPRLLPAIAAQAIAEREFFTPGQHVLHTLLDNIHDCAVGWQPELGRAGEALSALIEQTVANICNCFDGNKDNFASLCNDGIVALQKDQHRAQRMTQRLVDAEKGRLKTASARWKGAEMINRHLADNQATPEIGAFLRGPWYDSAQLVLLKYRADSKEWAAMTAVTRDLLESLTINAASSDAQRQRLFEQAAQIPREIKRWLLSLHMDATAIDEVIGHIESAHVSLLRNLPLKLQSIETLHMEGMTGNRVSGENLQRIDAITPGQWFVITQSRQQQPLRVQLALKLGQEQLAQFTNKAGLKALELGFEEFLTLLDDKRAIALPTGDSFSRCLAETAGISTVEQYSALTGIKFEPEEAENPGDSERSGAPIDEPDAEVHAAEEEEFEFDAAEMERMYLDNLEADRKFREMEAALEGEQADEDDPLPDQTEPATNSSDATDARQKEIDAAQQLEQEQAEQQQREAELAQQLEQEQAEQQQRETELAQQLEQEQAEQKQREAEQAESITNELALVPEQAVFEKIAFLDEPSAVDQQQIDVFLRKKQERQERLQELAHLEAAERVLQTVSTSPDSKLAPSLDDIDIHIPMGTWLGFHDSETPTMAKLAVHDPEQDSYIFVNRRGIKMRSLNKAELMRLINENLIDMLEARSDFRADVIHLKNPAHK